MKLRFGEPNIPPAKRIRSGRGVLKNVKEPDTESLRSLLPKRPITCCPPGTAGNTRGESSEEVPDQSGTTQSPNVVAVQGKQKKNAKKIAGLAGKLVLNLWVPNFQMLQEYGFRGVPVGFGFAF